MEEKVVEFLSSPLISPFLILLVAFFFQYIENLFPVSPSDVVLLFLGSLASFHRVDLFMLIAISTLGSTLGFLTMFIIGKTFGKKVLDTGKFKFINQESLDKTRKWFNRWGYGIVVANRFLSGTRAVISFFAGAANLATIKSTVLAGISALIWNLIIIYAGFSLGKNWKTAVNFIELYWKIVLAIIIASLLFYFLYAIWKRRTK